MRHLTSARGVFLQHWLSLPVDVAEAGEALLVFQAELRSLVRGGQPGLERHRVAPQGGAELGIDLSLAGQIGRLVRIFGQVVDLDRAGSDHFEVIPNGHHLRLPPYCRNGFSASANTGDASRRGSSSSRPPAVGWPAQERTVA